MKKLFFILALLSNGAFGANHFFVVDGSGSMSGAPMAKAKDAMFKLAKSLFHNNNNVEIALVVASNGCSETPRITTSFISDLNRLKAEIEAIPTEGGDSIASGFAYAQKIMEQYSSSGHIYMFGDGDGLSGCEGIKNIAEDYKNRDRLTPFTYIGTDWSEEEKNNWESSLKSMGGGSAVEFEAFDYNDIAEKRTINKQYFSKVSYVNADGQNNDGLNYPRNPWKCVNSDGLHWYSIDKDEQKINFYISGGKGIAKRESCESESLCLVSSYIDKLNKANVCGKKDWRLPDFFELSRLTQLGKLRRESLFPYVRVWPHISSTKGRFAKYRKGVNLDNGGGYDYREDKPYAAIFVSGSIDKSLFKLPSTVIKRSIVINRQEEKKSLLNLSGGDTSTRSGSSSQTITPQITVTAIDDHLEVKKGIMSAIKVTANDVPMNLEIYSVSKPKHGSAVIGKDKKIIIYLPSTAGKDQFKYTVIHRSSGQKSTATVWIDIKDKKKARVTKLKKSGDPAQNIPIPSDKSSINKGDLMFGNY